MKQEIQLNEHNKQEYPPMHTAEHILNQTMVRMFGCPRSKNAHIERKKSKCDYLLAEEPSAEVMAEVEKKINEVIDRHLPVTIEFMPKEEAGDIVDLSARRCQRYITYRTHRRLRCLRMYRIARGEYIRDRTFQAVELRLCRREITATFQIGIKFKASANGQIKIFYVSLQAIKGTF